MEKNVVTEDREAEFERDEVDLEEWALAHPDRRPPRCRTYRIRVDKQRFRVQDSAKYGREILALVGLAPDAWNLAQKFPGGRREPIEPDQLVDFREPGIERFESSPKQVQAGAELRRQFELPAEDVEFLDALGLPWEAIQEGANRGVVIDGFSLPPGLTPRIAALMIRVPPQYPAAALDMLWLCPAVTRTDNRPIQALATETFAGRTWQRWSRHRTGPQAWRPGVDNLATHLRFVEISLQRDATIAA